MKKFLAILLAVAMLAAVLVGCSNNDANTNNSNNSNSNNNSSNNENNNNSSNNNNNSSNDNNTPKRDDAVLAIGGEVLSTSIFNSNVTHDTMTAKMVYDSLVENDKDGNIIPALAKSWEISEDGLEYTFTLEEGIKFHNGSIMTAEDVVWSFDRGINSSYLATSMGRYCDHAEKVDDSTVKLFMKEPYAAILANLNKVFVIENQSYFENDCASNEDVYRMKPMGTGGYKFVDYTPGVGLTLESFEDYWRGEPAIKNMFMQVIADVNAVQAALETNTIDFAGVSSTVSFNAIPAYEANPDLEVYMGDGTSVWYMPINCTLPGYDNILVRQAIAHGLDKEYVLEVQSEGYGEIVNCLNSPKAFGFFDEPKFEYDVEKAKALLAEAGYPNGEGLDPLVATIRQDRQKGVEVFQECMKAIGITVDINVMENTTYLNAVREGEFGTSLIASTMPTDVAIFDQFWLEEGIGADNYARLADPDLQRMLPEAATKSDPAERLAIYEEAYAIANNLCAFIPVFVPYNVCVYRTGLYIGQQYPDAPFLRYEEMAWQK